MCVNLIICKFDFKGMFGFCMIKSVHQSLISLKLLFFSISVRFRTHQICINDILMHTLIIWTNLYSFKNFLPHLLHISFPSLIPLVLSHIRHIILPEHFKLQLKTWLMNVIIFFNKLYRIKYLLLKHNVPK